MLVTWNSKLISDYYESKVLRQDLLGSISSGSAMVQKRVRLHLKLALELGSV